MKNINQKINKIFTGFFMKKKLREGKFKKKILFGFCLVVFAFLFFGLNATKAEAATCTSLATGNWNTAGTWDCAQVPTSSDSVVIAAGHTITQNVASANALQGITINGTLNGGNYALYSTTLSIGSSGVYSPGSATITISGTSGTLFTKTSGGTFTYGTSTVTLSGNGDISGIISGTPTFYNLTSSGTGTKTLGEDLTVTNILNLASTGTFNTSASGNYTINAGKMVFANVAGTLNLNASTINMPATSGGLFSYYTAFTINVGTSTVNLTGTNSTAVISDTSYNSMQFYNLTVNSSGAAYTSGGYGSGGGITVANNLTITAGSLSTTASRTITAGHLIINGGTFSPVATTTYLNGTSGTLFTLSSGTFTYGTSTINLSGNGDAVVASGTPTFYRLTSSGTGTKSLGANLTFTNILTISAGTLDMVSYTINGNSTGSISSSGTLLNGKASTLTNLVELYVTNSTITMDATLTVTGALTLGGTSVLDTTVNNYTVNFGSLTSSNNCTVNFNASTVNATGTSGSLFMYYNNVSFNWGTSTVNLTGASSTATISNVSYNYPTFYNLTINSSGASYTSGGFSSTAPKVTNNFTITAGTYTPSSGFAVYAGRLIINGGTFSPGSSIVYLTGTSGTLFTKSSGTYTISTSTINVSGNGDAVFSSGLSATTFNNVTFSGTGTKSLGENLTLGASNTLTVSGGILDTTSANSYSISTGKFSFGASGTLTANASTISLTATSGTLFTLLSGTFTAGTSTVNMTGNGSATINSGAPAFYNLTSSGTGTKTVGAAFSLNSGGTLSVTAGIFAPSTYLITGSGSNTISVSNATLQVGASTFAGNYSAGFTTKTMGTDSIVTYIYSSAGLTIDPSITYYNLYYQPSVNSRTASLSDTTTVTNYLLVGDGSHSGTFSTAGYTLNVGHITLATGGTNYSFGSSTVNITATSGYGIDCESTGTSSAGTSTINLTGNGDLTFNYGGGSPSYIKVYNLTISGTGTKSLGAAVTINSGGTLTVSVGTFDPSTYLVTGSGTNTVSVANGATLKVGGTSFTDSYSAGFTTKTLASGSTVEYSKAGDQNIAALSYSNLAISGSGTKSLGAETTATGNVTISAGTLSAGSYTLNVGGNWSNSSTFTAGTGLVFFNGSGNQTINNSNTWYGLKATTSTARTIYFQSGATQTISNNGSLTFQRTGDGYLTLAPTSGTAWNLTIGTGVTQSIYNVSVSYSDASGGAQATTTNGTNQNGGNNTNWDLSSFNSPTVAFSYSADPAKAGAMTVTATYSSNMVGTPNVSIDQPGSTDISNQAMSGGPKVFTYGYTVVTANGSTYIDGEATASLSGSVVDEIGRSASAPTNTTFIIDTTLPSSTITAFCSVGGNGCTEAGASANPQEVYLLDSIAGTAGDNSGGSGLASVLISIKDVSDSHWLSESGGTFTSDSEVFFAPTGTTTWSYDSSSLPVVINNTYQVRSKTTDNAENVETPQSLSFKAVNSPPVVSNVTAEETTDGTGTVNITYDVTDNESANTTNYLFYGVGATLSGDITSGSSSVVVSDGTNFPSSGTILINDEMITYTSKSVNTLQGTVVRGANNSTAASHTSGATVYIEAVSATGTGIGESAKGTGKAIAWVAKTDVNNYENGSESIKIVADDGATASMIGSASPTAFVLDTKAPVGAITFDAGIAGTTDSATINIPMPTDLSSVYYKISDDPATQTNPVTGSWTSIAEETNIPWTFDSDVEAKTLKYQFKDAYGNTTTEASTSTQTPIPSTSFMVQDTSNLSATPPYYDMYVGWQAASAEGFDSYKLEYATSSDNVTYGAYSTIITSSLDDASTNYYMHRSLNSSLFYRYRLGIVGTNGNTSVRSNSYLTTKPDGVQNYSEGGGGSVASASRVENVVVTQNANKTVTIDYKLTDTSKTKKVSPSYEGYLFYNIGITLPADALVGNTLLVSDASKMQTSGYIQVNNEVLKYTGKTGNMLTGLTRGTWPILTTSGRSTRQNTLFFSGTPVWILANGTTPIAITDTSIVTGQNGEIAWDTYNETALAGYSFSNVGVRVLVHDNQDPGSGPLSTQSDYSENGILGTLDLTAPTIQFNTTTGTGDVAVTPVSVTVDLARAYPVNSTVNYTVTGTATGGGVDYTLANGTATVTAGQTSTTVDIVITNHLLSASPKTIILTLSSPTNASLGTNTVYTYSLTGALADTTSPTVALTYSANPAAAGTNTITATYSEAITSTPNISIDQQGSTDISAQAMTNISSITSSYPTTQTSDYVKATSSYHTGEYLPYYATDPAKSLVGIGYDGASWLSEGSTNQRFHIDLGSAKTITKIYYENFHETGDYTYRGVKNFTFWGSNDASAFADLTYGDDTNWTQITTDASQMAQHVALNQADPHYINATNTTAYRYYAFKFADNWSGSGYMGLRRVELQTQSSTTFSYDYTVHNANGSTYKDGTATVSLSATQDAYNNPSEAPTNATFEIETLPTLQFDSASSSGGEGTASVEIPLSISEAFESDVTVDYTLSGTATGGGTDYTLANGTATIAAGQTSTHIDLSVVDDLLKEDNETVILTLSNPTNSVLGANTVYTYTIEDNDTLPTVAFDSTSSTGPVTTTPVQVPVSISAAYPTDVTVDYTVSGTASGGGVNYTLANGTATITAGQTTTNIEIVVVNHPLSVPSQTIILTLSNPTNATLGVNTVYTYTLTSTAPTIQFTSTSSSGATSVSPVSVPLTLSESYPADVTVDYTVSGTATGGGVDYTLANGTATITAGQTTTNISILITNHEIEESKTIILTLSNPSGASLGTNTVYTYTLTVNTTTVQFSSASSSGSENVSLVNIPVEISAAYTSDVTVDYTVSGTATGGGVNYTLADGTATIATGQTITHIPLAIVDTSLKDVDKTVILTLSNPSNASLGTNTVYTYTIVNDNAPTIQFTNTSSSGLTSVSSVDIPISISAVSAVDSTVNYTVTGTATGGGTDYTLADGTATITAGETTTDISLLITNHTLSEPNLTIILTLSTPVNCTLGTNTTYTYTLINGSSVKATSATVSWTTENYTDSKVEYGTVDPGADRENPAEGSYNLSKYSITKVLEHNVYLGSLTPLTTYYARMTSTNADNETSVSYTQFTTTDGPIISSTASGSVTDVSAIISWTTNIAASSYVSYSTDATLASSSRSGTADLVTSHSVTLTGLTPETTYYFYVDSTDGSSNIGEDANGGDYYSFTTLADQTPPTISSVATPVITSTQVAITWTTNEDADGQIEYGTATGTYDEETTLVSTLVKNHLATISDLTASTKYYYVIKSADENGNMATSEEKTFDTTASGQTIIYMGGGGAAGVAQAIYDALLAENAALKANSTTSDNTPPVISNIKVSDISSFAATISFDTDDDTVAFINYGKDKGHGLTVADKDWSKTHIIKMTGLSFGTDYYFQINAMNKSNKITTSEEQNFKTKFFSENLLSSQKLENIEQFQAEIESSIESILPSLTPPFISSPAVAEITENSALVSFKTNVKAYPVVSYTPDSNYDATKDNPYDGEMSDTTKKSMEHSLNLIDLKPNTKYHVMAKAFSLPQVVGKSADITFMTLPAKIQGSILNIQVNSFTVVWTTDEPSTSIVEYKNLKTGITERVVDNTMNTSHSIKIDNLPSGITYEVNISGINEKGNTIQGGNTLTVTTSTDLTPPVITNVKVDNTLIVGQTERVQTIISWTTDEPATSVVYYEEGPGSVDKVLTNKQENLELTKDHAIILTTFKPGTIYRFTANSVDSAGNIAKPPIRTIITPQKAESIMDVIFKNFDQTFNFLKKVK